MSDDKAEKVAEEINDAMSEWMASKNDKRTALQVIAVTVRPHLSPPAAGPGLDADGFVLRAMKAGAEYGIPEVTADNIDRLKEIRDRYAAELRAALSTGEGDEPGNQLCESCESPATHRDIDDVPLCKVCYDELPPLPERKER